MIERIVWMSAAVLSTLLLTSLLHQPVGWPPLALLGAIALVAVWRPHDALLVFVGLGPLAAMIFVLLRTSDSGVRFHEAMALAFLTGFAIRRVFVPRSSALPQGMYACVIVLLALVLASGAVSMAILVAEEPALSPTQLLQNLLTEDYFVLTNPVTAAGLFAGGLFMMLAVADLCAGDPVLRRNAAKMLIIGAAAAASLNIVRIVALALAREESWSAFLTFVTTLRVNVHYSDLNAAGSFFALALCVALGLLKDVRTGAALCACLIAVAVWITGSRIALAALLVLAIGSSVGLLYRRGARRVGLAAVAVVIAASIALWFYYPRERNAPVSVAFEIRAALARGALEMVSAEPVFGVGIGRFYPLSVDYTLRQHISPRENAHNNFLQILAELGIPGLMLFLAVIGFALRQGVRSARESPVVAGLVAGICGYLLTCLGGHPLLVDAAAYPFWVAVGLVATTSAAPAAGQRALLVMLGLVAVIAVSLPMRIVNADRHANVEHASIGFSLWQRESDGSRYRWAGGQSRFFAPPAANAVVIPLRAGNVASSPVSVRIFLDGRQADQVVLEPGGEWHRVRLLVTRRTSARFARIDLEASVRGAPRPADAKTGDTSGLLMVGRPEFTFPPGVKVR